MPTPKVWIAKRDQFSIVKDENPERAVTEFGRKFGKRGNITLSENIRDGEMLRFVRGCRMLKGPYATILKQAQVWEDDDTANNTATAAVDKAPKPEAYIKALSYLDYVAGSKDIVIDIRDDNENPIMGHTRGFLLKWVTKARQHSIYVRKSKEEPWKKLDVYEQGRQTRQFFVMLSKLLPKYIRAEITSSTQFMLSDSRTVVRAADTMTDRAASIVFGDLKRIRSTIASWQGKMKPEEYKEFVEYEKSVAKFIKDKFVPKLPQTYKDKLAKL